MNATTRQRWSQFYRTFQEPRSYTKTIDIDRTIGQYSVGFEVSMRLWENNDNMPSIEAVSEIEAFDAGGHQIRDKHSLQMLNSMTERWCQIHIDEIIELIEKASKE